MEAEPAILMTEEERAEAERMARIAARAEEKARHGAEQSRAPGSIAEYNDSAKIVAATSDASRPTYLSKEMREKAALERLQARREGHSDAPTASKTLRNEFGERIDNAARSRATHRSRSRSRSYDRGRRDDRFKGRDDDRSAGDRYRERDRDFRDRDRDRDYRDRDRDYRDTHRERDRDRGSDRHRGDESAKERERERNFESESKGAEKTADTNGSNGMPTYVEDERIRREKLAEVEKARKRYLGIKEQEKKVVKNSEKFQKLFKMDWDATEDTSHDINPLYANRMQPSLLFGRGYQAGIDMKEQRKSSKFLQSLAEKRMEEAMALQQAAAAAATAETRDEYDLDMTSATALRQATAANKRKAEDDVDHSMGLKGKHWSDKALSDMSERDWRIMREDFDIHVKGGKPLNPLRSWDECNIHPTLRRAIDEMGYVSPSPIQRQAIPMGLAGRDLIGVAETGSGKTAAFLIPLLTYILNLPAEVRAKTPELGPLALVMAPTRELAQQIEAECRKLAKYAGIRSVSVVGGTSIQEQGHQLVKGIDVIIGTPGRLIDALDQAYLVLHHCQYVVLDEADRMIDMGFEPQVTAVLDAMGASLQPAGGAGMPSSDLHGTQSASSRTTHMFTATMPPEVERITKKYLRNPATVKIGDEDSGKNKRIAQEIIFVASEAKKKHKLFELLATCQRPVIVFLNAKKQCDVISRDLEMNGYGCGVLHSGKTQELREASLADFKSGAYDILIATDVAGRGLDIPDVAQVINYDMPAEIDRYTHRIGRTGRAGKTGKATTFITDDDAPVLPALKAYLESTGQQVPQEVASRASGRDRENVKYIKI